MQSPRFGLFELSPEKKGVFIPVFRWTFILLTSIISLQAIAQSGKEKDNNAKMREAENLFLDACRLDITENHEEALTMFKRVCEMNPKNGAAFYKTAELLLRQNNEEEALKYAEKAVQLDKNNSYYLEMLAEIQENTNQWKDAVKTYDDMIKRLPGGKKYRLSKARVYIKHRQTKNAIKELEKVEEETGPSPEIYQTRQQLYLQDDNARQAEVECKNWMKAFPEDDEAKMTYARFLIEQKRYKEAKQQLSELVESDQGFATAHLLLANLYLLENDEKKADEEIEKAIRSPELPVEAKIELVSGFLAGPQLKEDEDKALKLCELILESHPGSSKALILKGDLLNKFGYKKEARDCYIKAVATEKNNFALWEQLVLLDLNLNETDSIRKHTAEAKELFPNSAIFAFYNGLSNLILRQYEKSAESLEDARRLSVGNRQMLQEIYSQLGDAYYNLKDNEKSFAAYDEALKLDSSNAHVLNNYAYFLSLEKSRLQQALNMSRRLVALHPDDPTFLDTHGWVLYQKGDFAEALGVLEKAAGQSKSGTIWEHYGDALFQNGKTDKALEAWKKARELSPGASEQLDKKLKDKKLP